MRGRGSLDVDPCKVIASLLILTERSIAKEQWFLGSVFVLNVAHYTDTPNSRSLSPCASACRRRCHRARFRRARVSLIMITPGLEDVSALLKSRPLISEMPGVTVRGQVTLADYLSRGISRVRFPVEIPSTPVPGETCASGRSSLLVSLSGIDNALK